MSRPTGSVPSRNCDVPPLAHAGGVNVNSRYCSFGGWGLTISAKSARSTSSTTSARPINAPRLCAYDRQNSARRPGGAPVPTAGVASSGMTYPRIDHAVEHVDDEIDADDDRRDQQNAALDNRIIARLDAVDQPIADARPGENRFGEDRARQQQTDLEADDGDDRDQRIA